MAIPFLRPSPPKLSELIEELISIEQSGRYTNYGPVNSQFEVELINKVFGGQGACVTTCNATVGLMIAIREAMSEPRGSNVRYALMPSFTFAATAHAAIWAGLTPLLCDIDPQTWLPCPQAEEELLRTHAGEIAVLIPYATFGNNLDLARYDRISSEYGVPVVIDAAASLGSVDENGRGFGTGSRHAIVYSMHATKTFATAEGGVIYCEDSQRVARLRSMGNFGFEVPRTATMPGLNAKLSEIGALLALKRLEDFEAVVAQRTLLADAYRTRLAGFGFQQQVGQRIAHQFMPILLPKQSKLARQELMSSGSNPTLGARA
ncbi:MAG: DegT/DnrJ/EryC1/StrS family aminotransferase [Roseiarcus sp.]